MKAQIQKIIKCLTKASSETIDIFTRGGCYQFYKLLKIYFPNAVCWYDMVEGHCYTEIDNKFYDIRGEHKFNSEWINTKEKYGEESWDRKAGKWHC